MNNLFYSLITLAVAFVFLLTGIIGMLIPWSPEVRHGLTRFINEDYITISLFGLTFLLVSGAIIANILMGLKRRYYHLRVDTHSVDIDEAAIQQLLNAYWLQTFPGKDIPSRLTVKNNRIHIVAELPHIPLEEQETLFERIKSDLQEIFANLLGYRSEFTLTFSVSQS